MLKIASKRGWRSEIVAILFGLFALIAAAVISPPASACSCERVNKSNAATMISLFEIIVDGVVIERDPLQSEGNSKTLKAARLRVDHVWKGDLPGVITLIFHEGGASCGAAPPLGRQMRLVLSHHSETTFSYGLCSDLLEDSQFEKPLAEYSARTDAMLRSTESQGRDGLLDFARYLARNHESHRAFGLYSAMLRDDPRDLDAMLGEAVTLQATQRTAEAVTLLDEAKDLARTEADQGEVARAAFQITGQIDPGWKDWSGLENYSIPCHASHVELSGTKFDDARLIACEFVGSPLQDASFLGTDLTHTNLGNADARGAKYDCRTQFQKRFDPVAAGMINVEGSCGTP